MKVTWSCIIPFYTSGRSRTNHNPATHPDLYPVHRTGHLPPNHCHICTRNGFLRCAYTWRFCHTLCHLDTHLRRSSESGSQRKRCEPCTSSYTNWCKWRTPVKKKAECLFLGTQIFKGGVVVSIFKKKVVFKGFDDQLSNFITGVTLYSLVVCFSSSTIQLNKKVLHSVDVCDGTQADQAYLIEAISHRLISVLPPYSCTPSWNHILRFFRPGTHQYQHMFVCSAAHVPSPHPVPQDYP